MTIKTTLLIIGLVTTVPAVSMAAQPKVASNSRVQSAQAKETKARSTEDDPIGDWLEKNGSRFGLYIDGPAKSDVKPGAKTGTNPLVKKIVAGPEDILAGKGQGTDPDPIAKFATPTDPESSAQKKVFTPPPAALRSNDAAAQIAAVMNDLDFSAKCDKFATENGFGVWGRTIVDELVRGNGNSMLQGTDDLRRACPNYDYLGVREKSYVWVKIIASMSFLESSCDAQAGIHRVVKGPNGRAVGLLQLHQNKEGNYAENCNHRDAMNPIKTLTCGISMLDRQIEKTNALFSRASYWGVLRPQGDLVKTKRGNKRVVLARTVVGGLKELPFCQRR